MPNHLYKRKSGNYLVQIPVPRPHRALLGRKVYERTTGTTDLKLATRRAPAIIAELRARMAEETAAAKRPKLSGADALVQYAVELRDAVYAGALDDAEAVEQFDHARDAMLRKAQATPSAEPEVSPEEVERVLHAGLIASGKRTVGELVDEWLRVKCAQNAPGTRAIKRHRLAAFVQFIGADEFPSAITKKVARGFVAEVVNRMDVSTVNRKAVLQTLSQWAAWLEGQELIEIDPFRGVRVLVAENGAAPVKHRAFKQAELLAVLELLKQREQTVARDLLLVMAYSAARPDELMHVKAEDVTAEGIRIRVSKSVNGRGRIVPVHSAVRPLIDRLVERAGPKGYLFESRTAKRYAPISNHLSRAITDTVGDDPSLVAYSTKHGAVTQMREAGHLGWIVQQIIGHRADSIMDRHYTGQPKQVLRQAAIDSIDNGYEVAQVAVKAAE